jgi:hypothetical protein
LSQPRSVAYLSQEEIGFLAGEWHLGFACRPEDVTQENPPWLTAPLSTFDCNWQGQSSSGEFRIRYGPAVVSLDEAMSWALKLTAEVHIDTRQGWFYVGPSPPPRRLPRWPPADVASIAGLDPENPPQFSSMSSWRAKYGLTLCSSDYARAAPVFEDALLANPAIRLESASSDNQANFLSAEFVVEAPFEPLARKVAHAAGLSAATAGPEGLLDPFAWDDGTLSIEPA